MCLLTSGDMQDLSYFKGNCFEVTFQLSCCKYPLASDLYTEWNNNREALLAFMEKVREYSDAPTGPVSNFQKA